MGIYTIITLLWYIQRLNINLNKVEAFFKKKSFILKKICISAWVCGLCMLKRFMAFFLFLFSYFINITIFYLLYFI